MAPKINEQNERQKHKYAIWMRNAKRADIKTVDKALEAIKQFETSTGFKCFKIFKIEQAVAFKEKLQDAHNRRTGKPLAKATIDGTLRAVKAYFLWLADQKGFRSRIRHGDVEYFNLNAKDVRIAHAQRGPAYPTMEQCRHAFAMMPEDTVFQRRDKAMFAFLMLTAMRDGAMASLRLKHIDLVDRCVHQDAREVKTKGAKTFTTWFFPVDAAYLETFTAWVTELRKDRLFGPGDALFPKAVKGKIDGAFALIDVARETYADANQIRRAIRVAFTNAGLPSFGPHSFRQTIVALGNERCPTPEAFKAWSMNLGHESIVTTMSAYCRITPERQRELIRRMN